MAFRPALLIIDAISDFAFEDGGELFERAWPIVKNIQKLKNEYSRNGQVVLFVNDNNEGQIGDADELLQRAETTREGRSIVTALRPDARSVILKPQRSGFYGTDLDETLRAAHVTDLTIVGWTTDICVLFTAHDAYMRKFKVAVPEDCTAAVKPTHHTEALQFLRRVAHADTNPVAPALQENSPSIKSRAA